MGHACPALGCAQQYFGSGGSWHAAGRFDGYHEGFRLGVGGDFRAIRLASE